MAVSGGGGSWPFNGNVIWRESPARQIAARVSAGPTQPNQLPFGLINGDFSAGASPWVTGGGTTISGGICTATSESNFLYQEVNFVPGAMYRVTFDYTCTSGNSLRVATPGSPFAGTNAVGTQGLTVDGATHSLTFDFAALDIWFGIEASGATFTGTIDNVTAVPLGAAVYNDTLTETTATGDSLNPAGSSFGVADAESAATGDLASATQVFSSPLTETSGAQDSLTGGLLLTATLNEAMAPADSLGAAAAFGPALTETAAAGDNLASQAAFGSALTETALAADNAASNASFVNALGESAGAADSVTATLLTSGALTETAAAADAVATAVTFRPALAESAAAADAVAGQDVIGAALGESAGAGATEGSTAAMPNALGETVGAGDSLGSGQVFSETLAETAAPADDVSAGARTFDDAVTETLAANADLAAGLGVNLTLGEGLEAVDGVTSSALFGAPLAEQAGAGDQLAAATDQAEALAEQLSANDSVDGSISLDAALAEEVAASAEAAADRIVGAATRQRQILLALEALVAAAVPQSVAGFGQDARKPVRSGQREIGDPGVPRLLASEIGAGYFFRQPVAIALTSATGEGGEALDAAVAALGAAIVADRTLGGLVDWLEMNEVRRASRSTAGVASLNWVNVPLTVEWRADDPLAA